MPPSERASERGNEEVMEGGDETNHRQQHSFGDGRNSAVASQCRYPPPLRKEESGRERDFRAGRAHLPRIPSLFCNEKNHF